MIDLLFPLIASGELLAYCDDLLIITRGKKRHKVVLKKLFELLSKGGIKVSLNKSFFFAEKFRYLGWNFERDHFEITEDRIKAITEIPAPKNIKQCQALMGTLAYVSRFLPSLQDVALPITNLINKNSPFFWTAEHDNALEAIKDIVRKNC